VDDPGSILEALGPARRFADPEAPIEARMMAARGALPLPPDKIASVLFALGFDPDPEVKARALTSLEQLPDRVVLPTLAAAVHPALLAWFAHRHHQDGDKIERIALNPATSDETICAIAALPFPRVVEIIANNQTRLLRCGAILDALGDNPLTSASTIDRILEFLGLRRDDAASEEPAAPSRHVPSEEADAATLAAARLDDPSDLPPELLEERDAPADPDAEPEDERSRSLYALVQDMKVIDRVKLARFGNAEARALLVRDRNRIVASAAVRSPKITENEIVAIAKSRNVCDEVLRIVAGSRLWTGSYRVQLGLVTNPKTPIGSAIKFLNYLTDRDLKTIMRSREVPAPISTQARRILAKKGKV
jgi:hypothetical protein